MLLGDLQALGTKASTCCAGWAIDEGCEKMNALLRRIVLLPGSDLFRW
jgi:hypothetical protein